MNKTPHEILGALDKKFSANFDKWAELNSPKLGKTFMLLRTIATVGEALGEIAVNQNQTYCSKIYDEIFSDSVSAIYLATNGMDKPANIVLRRVTELSVAAIYLWDMPHMMYSWKNHDQDLSFSEMLSHVNSKGYRDFVCAEASGGGYVDELFPSKDYQSIYGDLSDIVHGKISTFETALSDSFEFRSTDWSSFLRRIDRILTIILRACTRRYEISNRIIEISPSSIGVLK